MIDSFFTSGHVADLVLFVMAIEVLIIYALIRRGRIDLPFRTYLYGVIAGCFIVLALRFALTEAAGAMIAIALALSFAAHLGELFSFLQRNNGNPNYRSISYNRRSDKGTTTRKDP